MNIIKPSVLLRDAGIPQQAVADVVGRSQGAVSQWKRVPPEYVLRIEAAFPEKLSRHLMRPDLYPKEASAA